MKLKCIVQGVVRMQWIIFVLITFIDLLVSSFYFIKMKNVNMC